MRLESKVGLSLRRIVISPSEFAIGEPTSLVRGRVEEVLLPANIFFDKLTARMNRAVKVRSVYTLSLPGS